MFSNLLELIRIAYYLIISGIGANLIFIKFNSNTRYSKLATQLPVILPKLGPFYVKLGQFFAARPDLISDALSASLRNLQDKMPLIKTSEAIKVISQSLGVGLEEIFESFEDAHASASIAQIHKAKLKLGREVAVKVIKPLEKGKFKQNIKLIKSIAYFLELFSSEMRRIRIIEVINQMDNMMRTELNLKLEAAAASKLFSNCFDDCGISVPEIFWQYSSEDVIVMEWVEALPIVDYIKTDIGKDAELNKNLASRLVTNFLNQAFRDGFFHADLHPGNIMIGANGQIYLLDFGITSFLDITNRNFIADILYGFITRDYENVANLHFAANYISQDQNKHLFELYCMSIAEPILDMPPEKISIALLLSNLFMISKKFNMETQIQLLMLQKNMVYIEGLGRLLCPNTNIWKLAEPWLLAWSKKRQKFAKNCTSIAYTFQQDASRFAKNLTHALENIANLECAKTCRCNQKKQYITRLKRSLLFCLLTALIYLYYA